MPAEAGQSRDRPPAGVDDAISRLTMLAEDAGFGRFGRVVRQHWDDTSGGGAPGSVFKITHGYDRASNRQYAKRDRYPGHAEVYTYDNLVKSQLCCKFVKGWTPARQVGFAP